jgi:hypothetical protein
MSESEKMTRFGPSSHQLASLRHFCPNCGRSLPGDGREPDVVSEETVIEPAPER